MRVVFVIHIDLDFTNDTGTYIMLYSDGHEEEEWMLGPGAEFKIGEIYPDIRKNKKVKIEEDK